MKQASNWSDLKSQMMERMTMAMNQVHETAKKDTEAEVKSFYSMGKPKIYKRTGKLGNSVKTNNSSAQKSRVDFYIWLDRTYKYTVPNPDFIDRGYASYFSTPMVFDAAEDGLANIKGRPGFWKRSEKKIKSDLDKVFSIYFE